eukprot:PLAT10095.1.p1 GENE.PLAT10095.1~~PLAT10095.1.p1  ORF type:complete len:726 (+),score=364.78 PLAT10095.1:71-2248(+)
MLRSSLLTPARAALRSLTASRPSLLARTAAITDSSSCATVPTGIFGRLPAWHRTLATSSRSRTSVPRSTRRMEMDASLRPDDAHLQAKVLRDLNRARQPDAVIRRYESGEYAMNEASWKEYVFALARTGELASRSASDLALGRFSHAGSALEEAGAAARALSGGGGGGGSAITSGLRGSSAEMPLYVQTMAKADSPMDRLRRIMFMVFLGGGAYYLLSNMSSGGGVRDMSLFGGDSGFGEPDDVRETSFDDIQGIDQEKGELMQVVDYLRNPGKYERLGAEVPKGVLLIGPPGTGKTMMARAVACEAGVKFFYASGSSFDEVLVGVGMRRVKKIFADARAAAEETGGAIIFIDEIDQLGSQRKNLLVSHNGQTLNQLLTEMDGVAGQGRIIVIGATNLPERMDDALLRPGRFDRKIHINPPDVHGRRAILEASCKAVPLSDDVDFDALARMMPGMSGADLKEIVNYAALEAARTEALSVSHADFMRGLERVKLGLPRNMLLSDEDKRNVAYHEGGHALVTALTAGAGKVQKITILPRGQALGVTWFHPEKEHSMTRKEVLARIMVAMGGRVGEELSVGPMEVTGGCSSDLAAATRYARFAVAQMGMSDRVGKVHYTAEAMKGNQVSQETMRLVDEEVRLLCEDAYSRTMTLLKKNRGLLDKVVEALLEYETLSGHELQMLIDGTPVRKLRSSKAGGKKDKKKKKKKQNKVKADKKDDGEPVRRFV